ncbi:hypothetical protein Fcan01_15397 [Folsomia candida]|uniref:Uncharacterized protein n=1 Tax=Folsomia candida TaxID=158441 RepID=A0A226DWP6_FOLCA|nr:hypothetical protein Fcan01_15397 [Folsomia candida]
MPITGYVIGFLLVVVNYTGIHCSSYFFMLSILSFLIGLKGTQINDKWTNDENTETKLPNKLNTTPYLFWTWDQFPHFFHLSNYDYVDFGALDLPQPAVEGIEAKSASGTAIVNDRLSGTLPYLPAKSASGTAIANGSLSGTHFALPYLPAKSASGTAIANGSLSGTLLGSVISASPNCHTHCHCQWQFVWHQIWLSHLCQLSLPGQSAMGTAFATGSNSGSLTGNGNNARLPPLGRNTSITTISEQSLDNPTRPPHPDNHH